jgi:hypothetical protein
MSRAIPNLERETKGLNGNHRLPPPHERVPLVETEPVAADGEGEAEPGPLTVEEELAQLRGENAELRHIATELEQQLNDATRTAQLWAVQQHDNERMLEEKSDVIRELHVKIQELQSQLQSRPVNPAATPREEELLALSEELEQERNQLKEDEESLMQQMREMEVQMSRERADLARQRNELQRLHSEIRHELEQASRQAGLRDRLEPLQRRHQEILLRKGAEPPREVPSPQPAQPAPAPRPEPRGKDSGLFRRLFGKS